MSDEVINGTSWYLVSEAAVHGCWWCGCIILSVMCN